MSHDVFIKQMSQAIPISLISMLVKSRMASKLARISFVTAQTSLLCEGTGQNF